MIIAGSFIGYILLFGVFINIVLASDPPEIVWYVLVMMFFFGWFLVIGLVMEYDEARHTKAPFFVKGVKSGIVFLKGWLVYMLGLAVIVGILMLL